MKGRRKMAVLGALSAALALSACGGSAEAEAAAQRPATGEELYSLWCADCHDAGSGHPGTLRLQSRQERDAAVLTKRANDPSIVRFAVRTGFQMMPPFRITEISDDELNRIVDYLAEPQP